MKINLNLLRDGSKNFYIENRVKKRGKERFELNTHTIRKSGIKSIKTSQKIR